MSCPVGETGAGGFALSLLLREISLNGAGVFRAETDWGLQKAPRFPEVAGAGHQLLRGCVSQLLLCFVGTVTPSIPTSSAPQTVVMSSEVQPWKSNPILLLHRNELLLAASLEVEGH